MRGIPGKTLPARKRRERGRKRVSERERMPFTLHLEELRRRLFIIVLVIIGGFVVCFNFSEHIFRVLTLPMHSEILLSITEPYVSIIPKGGKVSDLIFLGPAEAFWAHLKISLIAAIVVTSPLIFIEIWRFISPGLHRTEKKFAVPFVIVTSGLFIFGTLFCFLIVLPFAMKFLLNFKTQSLTPMISVEKYIDFCLKFILAFGVVFELPVVIVFLTRSGIVSIDALSKNRKYAVLLAFVAAALLTPTPDAFNQTLMAVPIIVLFEGGLIAARIFARRREKALEREEKKEKGEDSGGT
jgi:sec-independent protein translocase protein TatC